MNNQTNPLIAETPIETVQNVTEAMESLMTLMATQHSGLCRLMEPLLHALQHAADQQK